MALSDRRPNTMYQEILYGDRKLEALFTELNIGWFSITTGSRGWSASTSVSQKKFSSRLFERPFI